MSSKIKNGTPKPRRVKTKALVVFEDSGRLLLAEYRDKPKAAPYYRPLGGSILFGERAEDAARREIQEELGISVPSLSYLGALENIFASDTKSGHEILIIYRGSITDPALLALPRFPAQEGDDRFWAVWVPVDDIQAGRAVCYPAGLLDLLRVPALV